MIAEKRYLTLNVQIEKQDFSCFEILSRLRLRLFWSREGLINKITEARKDSRGDIEWVEFAKAHHSHLVASCFAVMPAQLTRASRVMVKRAMFVFILELHNVGRVVSLTFKMVVEMKTAHIEKRAGYGGKGPVLRGGCVIEKQRSFLVVMWVKLSLSGQPS